MWKFQKKILFQLIRSYIIDNCTSVVSFFIKMDFKTALEIMIMYRNIYENIFPTFLLIDRTLYFKNWAKSMMTSLSKRTFNQSIYDPSFLIFVSTNQNFHQLNDYENILSRIRRKQIPKQIRLKFEKWNKNETRLKKNLSEVPIG